MIARTKISESSPDPDDRTAHLKPLLDYLAADGNLPKNDPPFDSGVNQSIPSCPMQKKFNWKEIDQLFEFPESFVLSPKWGLIRDEKNVLEIVEGSEK